MRGFRYIATAVVAAAVAFGFAAATGWGHSERITRLAKGGASSRIVYARVGDQVRFVGLTWTCFVHQQEDPGGMPGFFSKDRRQVFCRYDADNSGCPWLIMAPPYLWVGNAPTTTFRRTSTGAAFLRTHYCS
jgi:hypothetical protein